METTDWDARYDRPDYLFGTEPTRFLREHAGFIAPESRVLCVADGEGRNAVWLAGQGHRVTSFEPSEVALRKAGALAQARGVSVERHNADIESWDWSREFDAVVAILVQFAPPGMRERFFSDMIRALAPGGTLLLHGYTPKQVEYGTGGPPHAEWMYTPELLRDAFGGLEILRLESYERDGESGKGRSARIDLIARRPQA